MASPLRNAPSINRCSTDIWYTRVERGNTVITQIEIDGFKTFKDFKVELAPFQVIVGPNGSGKSNLFDALHLLARLAPISHE